MNDLKKYHYVYQVTNCIIDATEKYYIGVRTSTIPPEDDISYMGSSKYLNEAIHEYGISNFKKEILSVWDTRKLANAEEIRLHNLYAVATNPEYYNRAAATSESFSTQGMVTVYDRLTCEKSFVSVEAGKNTEKYKKQFENRVNCVNSSTGENLSVSKEDFIQNRDLRHIYAGKLTAVNTKTHERKHVTVEEFLSNDALVGQQIGQVVAIDTVTCKNVSVDSKEFHSSSRYVSILQGTITVIDLDDGLTKQILCDDYRKFPERFKKIQSKSIGIFNDSDELIFTSYGNFKQFCLQNGLPHNAFAKSMQQHGKKLYENIGSNSTKIKKLGYFKFKGWYAINLTSASKKYDMVIPNKYM